MPIQFPVAPGTALLCDYNTGFRPPEMIKRRPVLVVSPRFPHRDGLCTIVPLSTTAPERAVAYQCRIALTPTLPAPFDAAEMWAKADMLSTVGFQRLDLFRTDRDQTGRRKFLHPKVSAEDLVRVRAAILQALGMGHLTVDLG